MDEERTQIEQQPAETIFSWKDHFTTVTPLSKYLAATLFIVLPFGAFWLGMEYGRTQNITVVNVSHEATAKDDATPAEQDWRTVLEISFKNFRDLDSFYYNEVRVSEYFSSNEGTEFKVEALLDGMFMLPDKAHLTITSTSILRRDEDGQLNEEVTDPELQGEVLLFGDSLYIKNLDQFQSLVNPGFGKYYSDKIVNLGDEETANFADEVLVAFQWLNPAFNLNNPELLHTAEYLGETIEDGATFLLFEIENYDVRKMASLWDQTETKLQGSNMVEGFDIERALELVENIEDIQLAGKIWISKDTLLPHKIEHVLSFTYEDPRVLIDAMKTQTYARTITFSRFNDPTIIVEDLTVDEIIDVDLVEKQILEQMEARREETLQ